MHVSVTLSRGPDTILPPNPHAQLCWKMLPQGHVSGRHPPRAIALPVTDRAVTSEGGPFHFAQGTGLSAGTRESAGFAHRVLSHCRALFPSILSLDNPR